MEIRDLPFVRIDEVFHVGSLDPEDRGASRASLEGPCLSVSVHPEEWGAIARTSGPTWTLERPGALWLQASDLDDAQRQAMIDWAVDSGHARRATLWRAWFFDDEADDWRFSVHEAEEEARMEVLDEDDVEDAPSETGSPVEPFPSIILTETGMACLERWRSALDGPDGAVLLYALRVVAETRPDVVGVWWDEMFDPASLSCPRGGIFPGRLSEFSIIDPAGIPHPKIGSRGDGDGLSSGP
jgi:hypothetical protein